MFLKSLKLTNFRNYSKLDFKFRAPITVLTGDNAQGKTNFLESIYFLSTTKSERADKDDELIKSGESVLRAEGEVGNQKSVILGSSRLQDPDSGLPPGRAKVTKGEAIKLEIAMQLTHENEQLFTKKRIKVNGIARRIIDYAANLAVVYFTPEDINLVTGSPGLRRFHIDQCLSQVDKSYKKALSSYEDIVIRKNRVLKGILEGTFKVDDLSFWTDQQIYFGTLISEKRRQFFEFLATAEKKFGDFKFEYLENSISSERLKEYQARELASTNSLIGPHRDDFVFKLKSSVIASEKRGNLVKQDSTASPRDDNLVDLSKFGSRAQQRTAVLDLKLSEASFMEQKLGDRPIMLLDDIFSELDLAHKKYVLDIAKLQQTIITAVDLENYSKKHLDEAEVFKVEEGKIRLT